MDEYIKIPFSEQAVLDGFDFKLLQLKDLDEFISSEKGYYVENGHITRLKINKVYNLDKFSVNLIGKLEHLEFLQIRSNRLNYFPSSIGNLIMLEELDLEDNKITSLQYFVEKLKNLKILNLRKNRLVSLPESLGNLYTLEILDLSDNNLSILPESLGKLINLKTLNISKNEFTTCPVFFRDLIKLEELNLGYNRLTSLPESLGNLINLKVLDLTDIFLSKLPEFIGNFVNLEKLSLKYNELTLLPNFIGNLVKIKELNLFGNKLTVLPESLSNLENLEKLDLRYNDLPSIPDFLDKLEKLENLKFKVKILHHPSPSELKSSNPSMYEKKMHKVGYAEDQVNKKNIKHQKGDMMKTLKVRVPYWKVNKKTNKSEIAYVDEEFHPIWGKEIINCLTYYNGEEIPLGHKLSPFNKIPPYDFLSSDGEFTIKRKKLQFEENISNFSSEKLVHADWMFDIEPKRIMCLKILADLDENTIKAMDADCVEFKKTGTPIIFIIKDDKAYDTVFQQSHYVGKSFPMLTIHEFITLIQARFFTHIDSIKNSVRQIKFFEIVKELALNYEKWELPIQKHQAEKIMKRMGFNPNPIEKDMPFPGINKTIPSKKAINLPPNLQYPSKKEFKCPKCGWEKPNLMSTTTCLNCQTGVIFHNNDWILANYYLDPDDFLSLDNNTLLTAEGKQLLKEQQAHLKFVDEMNINLRTMEGRPSPFLSVRVDAPMKFYESWIQIGLKLKEQNQFEKSIVALSHALNLNPYIGDPWHLLGTTLFSDNWCYPGYRSLLKATEVEPENDFIQFVKSDRESLISDQKEILNTAIMLGQKNDFPKGIEFLKLYLTRDPHDYLAIWLIAEGYNWIHKYKQAKSYYSKIFESKKKIDLEKWLANIFPHASIKSQILNSKLNLAVIYFNEKNYRAAIKYCNKDFSKIPNYNYRLLMFGTSFYKLKEFNNALRFLDKINTSLISKNIQSEVKELIKACKQKNGNIEASFKFGLNF